MKTPISETGCDLPVKLVFTEAISLFILTVVRGRLDVILLLQIVIQRAVIYWLNKKQKLKLFVYGCLC